MLMAADILLYRATRVPVGRRSGAAPRAGARDPPPLQRRFGETFPEPQPLHTKALKILGLDGKQKMSKSLGNSRPRRRCARRDPQEDRERLHRSDAPAQGRSRASRELLRLRRCRATSRRPRRPRSYHENCRNAAWGCVDSKRALAENMIKYARADPRKGRGVEGASRAHPPGPRRRRAARARTAHETMKQVRERLGLYQ